MLSEAAFIREAKRWYEHLKSQVKDGEGLSMYAFRNDGMRIHVRFLREGEPGTVIVEGEDLNDNKVVLLCPYLPQFSYVIEKGAKSLDVGFNTRKTD